jgi:hypothetical protein
MKEKLMAYLKAPSTYIILIIGGILALAVPAVARVLRPVAKAVPGSKA